MYIRNTVWSLNTLKYKYIMLTKENPQRNFILQIKDRKKYMYTNITVYL